MSSVAQICNLALGRVGGGVIASIDEQSADAVKCKALYEITRDHLLALYPWGFANRTKALSVQADNPVEWLYSYTYPNDCLRIHYIVPREQIRQNDANVIVPTPFFEHSPDRYKVAINTSDQKRIFTDREDAYINYTRAVSDTGLFDPLFVQALAWLLAIDLAIPLGGDSGKRYREEAREGLKGTIAQAVCLSENESQDSIPLPRNIQVRGGSTTYRDVINGDPIYRRH